MQVLIFEDYEITAQEIEALLKKYTPEWKVVGRAKTISECRYLLQSTKADVLFSDIHFGQDIIFEKLPELADFKGKVVFISGDNNFAAQSFEMNAINYLLKPIEDEAFQKMIVKINNMSPKEEHNPVNTFMKNLSETDTSKKRISFYTKDGFVVKKISEILYLKSDNNYTDVFFIGNEKILVTKTILHFEKMLEAFGFLRVHQSYIVNIEHVKLFNREDSSILMNSDHQIPVSQRKKSELMNLMNNTIF